MLDQGMDHIVLVHYRDITMSGHSPGSVSTFSTGSSTLTQGSNSDASQFTQSAAVLSKFRVPYDSTSSPSSTEVSSAVVTRSNLSCAWSDTPDPEVNQALIRLKEQLSLDVSAFYNADGISNESEFSADGSNIFASKQYSGGYVRPYQYQQQSEGEFAIASQQTSLRDDMLKLNENAVGDGSQQHYAYPPDSNEFNKIQEPYTPDYYSPPSSQPEPLFSVILRNRLQEVLWQGFKYLLHLRCLILRDIHGIVTTPDFGELPCLQVLKLHYCSSLEEIHSSLGHHAGLTYLSVISCHKLSMIPTITGMKKLKTLEILDCDALHEFPEIHATVDRHPSTLTTDTFAEFSRGSSSWAQWRNHDVFLSFIGEYDSKTFVDHLYSTFIQQGIHTYKPDHKTPSSGDSIGLSIKNAIEESQIAIIVFTKNYAGSPCCLDELSYIMKCVGMRGLHVMPIFYDVPSSDVQKQSGEFGKEFDKQELENMAKVESWRKALTGACDHSGWSLKHIANRNEGRYIKDIIATISHRLFFNSKVIKKDLIGIGPRLERLTSELAIGSDDVRMVVVGGIGGSGKTTIASCVYMDISRHFEGRCFVENIREQSSNYGIKKLQQKLLSTILKKEVDVPSDEEGKRMIQSMLSDRKVLIVLDDVNDPYQLELLAGSHDWFGGGSRIILTSREGNVLSSKVDALYDVSLLSNDEAIRLFRRHAFPEDNHVGKRKWRPSSSFVEAYDMLSQDVIAYANGVPLTLRILGSFLYEKDKDEWVSTLAKLRDVPDPDTSIIYKLKISYDGLQPDEKELFLDIACFFTGAFVDSLRTLLDAFSFQPFEMVNVLVKRSLISVSNGMFDMHDLVKEMANYIVRDEHPYHPQKHSRIWQFIDVAYICAIDAAEDLNKIQALYAPNYDSPPNLLKVVANMKNLQLLNVRQHVKEVVEEPLFLSNELRWISWENYPASSFPTSFQPRLLSSLILRNGLQKVLWQGYKRLPRLKVLDLHNSKNLIMTPDFAGLPNLERLVLSGCTSLEEIDRSIGYHERLVYLNLDSCEKLEAFPPIRRMPKLETLILSRCFRLLKFPEIEDTMQGLRHLNMEYSGIEVLPSSVGMYCINLVSINLIGCENLERIEGNFQRICVIMVDANAMRE